MAISEVIGMLEVFVIVAVVLGGMLGCLWIASEESQERRQRNREIEFHLQVMRRDIAEIRELVVLKGKRKIEDAPEIRMNADGEFEFVPARHSDSK